VQIEIRANPLQQRFGNAGGKAGTRYWDIAHFEKGHISIETCGTMANPVLLSKMLSRNHTTIKLFCNFALYYSSRRRPLAHQMEPSPYPGET
jgi:hypothetical protein